MRRKILRNRARLNMRDSGIQRMNRKGRGPKVSRYQVEHWPDKVGIGDKSFFSWHWREYAAMPIAPTRRRAKAVT